MCCLNVVIIAPTSTFHNKEVNSLNATHSSGRSRDRKAIKVMMLNGVFGEETITKKGKPEMCAQNAGFALGNAKIPKILATPSSLARSATHHDPPMMPHRIPSHRIACCRQQQQQLQQTVSATPISGKGCWGERTFTVSQ